MFARIGLGFRYIGGPIPREMQSENSAGVVIPFKYIRTQQIVVEGRIYRRRLPMLVDTGASRTIIHLEKALEIGLRPSGEDGLGGGVGGVDLTMHLLPSLAVELKGEQFAVSRPIAMDLSHVLEGLRRSRARQIAVVLGADMLRQYGALIDYQRCTMTLFP